MNKLDMIHKYIDRSFPDECDTFKEKARSLLDVTTTMVVDLFGDDEQSCSKFAETLSSYFKDKTSETNSTAAAAETIAERGSSNNNEVPVAPIVHLPKRANAPNAFCGYLRAKGKTAAEASAEWATMTTEQKETYRAIAKPVEETEDLHQFRPFLHWEKATSSLFTKYKLHIMAICAHENENGRIVAPLPICNSDASMKFFQELCLKTGFRLPARFERLVNQARSEEADEADGEECSSPKKRKISNRPKKKKNKSPSDLARTEDYKIVRNFLREIIGNVFPNQIPSSGHVPMAIFDKNGYYIQGNKDYRFVGWPLKEVLSLKSYTSSEVRLLKATLEKGSVKLVKLADRTDSEIQA